ncbi:MAG TPA: MlaD family protein [Gammaproteobacteria bacterium]|nr:MlaD family protein [Gammaproteobacteria bacterium]
MENRAHAYLVIAFLVLVAGGGFYLYYWLTMPPKENRIYRVVSTYGVGNLRAHSEVHYKGLVVGHVRSVRFSPKDPDKVIIRIGIQPRAPITRSMYAEVRTEGLTGGTYLSLNKKPSSSDKPLPTTPSRPASIPMRQSPIQDALGSAGKISQQLVTLTKRLNRLAAKDNRQRIGKVLERTAGTADRMEKVLALLEPSLKKLPELLASGASAVKDTRSTLKRLRALADTTGDQARKVGKAAEAVRGLAGSGKELAQNAGKRLFPNMEELADRLEETARSLRTLSEQLETQPSSLIYGPAPRPPGPGEPGFKKGGAPQGEPPPARPRQ